MSSKTREQKLNRGVKDACRRREEGLSIAGSGAAHETNTERVRQVRPIGDGPAMREVETQRPHAKKESVESERQRLLRIMRHNPGCTRKQLAQLSGVIEAKLPVILGGDVHILVQEQKKSLTFSDEDIKRALIRGANMAGKPLTSAGYDSVRTRFDGPSSARAIQRFKTWANACDFAGVAHGGPRRAEYKRRWTETEMLDWASMYLRSDGCRGTYKDFSDWAARTSGAPSAQTVRNTIGSWTTVKRAALALWTSSDD